MESTRHGARKILLTDISYIPYAGTLCYLPTVMDAYTKQILSYVLNNPLEINLIEETVAKLVEDHGIELHTETLIHSDQGWHYASTSFIQLVKGYNLRQSMSRKANCWDNAPQESFLGYMKDKIDISGCKKSREVKAVIDDWIDIPY